MYIEEREFQQIKLDKYVFICYNSTHKYTKDVLINIKE